MTKQNFCDMTNGFSPKTENSNTEVKKKNLKWSSLYKCQIVLESVDPDKPFSLVTLVMV